MGETGFEDDEEGAGTGADAKGGCPSGVFPFAWPGFAASALATGGGSEDESVRRRRLGKAKTTSASSWSVVMASSSPSSSMYVAQKWAMAGKLARSAENKLMMVRVL